MSLVTSCSQGCKRLIEMAGGRPIKALIDTGSDHNLFALGLAVNAGVYVHSVDVVLRGFGGQCVKALKLSYLQV